MIIIVSLLLLSSWLIHVPQTMRLCNSRIPEECFVCHQTSQRKWVIIKMLYRCLRRCIMMWTRLLTLVNPLGVDHMTMWPMGINHIQMWTLVLNHMMVWTRLLTLVQVGDWRKYALEAIIKLLFYSSLYHDKYLLFMPELY